VIPLIGPVYGSSISIGTFLALPAISASTSAGTVTMSTRERTLRRTAHLFREGTRSEVVALSSGFMTYANDAHPEYGRIRRGIEECAQTFVLLPSLDRELCVAETVRRQVARPFGRSSEREEAVVRTRFEIYMALPMRKVETMRPPAAIVDEILAALSPVNHGAVPGLEPSILRTPRP
jgi:hypothetical protein